MGFLPCYLAFVPSKNGQHQKPSGFAPKTTKFQAVGVVWLPEWKVRMVPVHQQTVGLLWHHMKMHYLQTQVTCLTHFSWLL